MLLDAIGGGGGDDMVPELTDVNLRGLVLALLALLVPVLVLVDPTAICALPMPLVPMYLCASLAEL
jgi:hypothetical protein